MNIKKILLFACFVPAVSFASYEDYIHKKGVHVLSASEYFGSKKDKPKPVSMSKESEENKLGYIKSDSNNSRIKFLLSLGYKEPSFKLNSLLTKIQRHTYTGLHQKASDIKLSFNFKDILKDDKNAKIIGFSPFGVYDSKYWLGIAEFFNYKNIGVCSYNIHDLKTNFASIVLMEETIDYSINKKVSSFEVVGNDSNGFLYTSQWWDDNFSHELQCANKNYSSEIKDKVINLSKIIDQ